MNDVLELLTEAEATDLWLVLADEPDPRLAFRMPAVLHTSTSTHDALIKLYEGSNEDHRRIIGERYLDLYG